VAALWPVVQLGLDFAGGSGTREDPYQVATAEQLNAVRDYLVAHFIQIADIDLDQEPWNVGEGWLPIGGETPFTGTYNGAGHRISGLRIERPEADYQGLFGQVSGASIRNVVLVAVDVRGQNYTGALAGIGLSSDLHEIRVGGRVEGHEYTGGICGAMYRGKIDQSESTVEVSGHSFVGGIAGIGEAHDCTAGGAVNGAGDGHRVGGLLGEGFAMNSVASGAVTGGSETGGLIGRGEAYGCRASGAVQGSGDYVGGLIGELAEGLSGEDDGVYGPGDTSPGDTTRLKDSIQLPGSGRIEIVLEDGTRFVMEGNGSEMTAEASRQPIDFDISKFAPEWRGFRPTGSMRILEIRGSGDPINIKPLISIPIEEIGTINPETVVILRVGNSLVDGEMIENNGMILPLIQIKGNNMIFVDPTFPNGVVLDSEAQNGSLRVDPWVGNQKYILLTYDRVLNWGKTPLIERMIPDTSQTKFGNRILSKWVSKKEQSELRKKPICNVVLLVHGHNEKEKDGFVPPNIGDPWGVEYKRLVFDLLYEEFVKDGEQDLPIECTSFFEFIYPTFRPIFSPILDKSGYRMPTLGSDLGRLVNERLLADEQIKQMLDADMEFNLYIIAHSQGGLVTRAGLRFMDERLVKKLKKVVTWGSPHGGASLYSLLYALSVGYDIVINDVRLPLEHIGNTKLYQRKVAEIALDAPGIRDMRWDVSKKEMLRLGELLQPNPRTIRDEIEGIELPYGRLFFSDNLKIFNESEGEFLGNLLKDKYIFYQGITPKLAKLEKSNVFILWELLKFSSLATSVEQGAQLNRLVMQDPHKDSDGAAPLSSQGGIFVYPGGGIQRRLFHDIDHEEFYGSEEPQRDESTKAKGRMIANETFTDLGLRLPVSKCPSLEWREVDDNDTFKFEGVLNYPIYDVVAGGDGMPGKRIHAIVCRADARDADDLQGSTIQIMDDGEWKLSISKDILNAVKDSLFIVVVLKDGSEVYGGVKVSGFAKVFNRTKRKWYGNIQGAITAAMSGDTIMVKPGVYKESIDQVSMIQKDLKIWSYDGAANTILESPVARQFNGFVVTRAIEIEGFTFRNYNDGIILQWVGPTGGEDPQKTFKNNIFQNCKRAIHTLQIKNVTISDNEFIDNADYAISIFRDAYVESSDSTFLISGNKIQGGLKGIRLRTGLSLPEESAPFRIQIIENQISQCTSDGIELSGLMAATLSLNRIVSCEGAGVLIQNTSNRGASTLQSNEVRQCMTGMDLGAYGQYTLSANTIIGNTESGVTLSLEEGSANMEQNIFQGNSPGGAQWPTPALSLYIYDNSVTVKSNQFLSNQNGAIHAGSGGSNLSIEQNTFAGNVAEYGGAIYTSGSVKAILNNVFESNQATDGGAIYGSAVQISGNQFFNNVATNDGGALYGSAGQINGNQFLNNFAYNRGGAIKGRASNWPTTATVTVAGQTEQVRWYVPCFIEATNTYSGNGHGSVFGAWGPGTDNWCQSAGYDVHD
jgi:predicted outer membrane repeat protein